MKIFRHRKRTQILGYRSPDWWKAKKIKVKKTQGLTFKEKYDRVKII